ncbi:ABC transporter family protein [Hazenella coriacea]|uniref:ABC transporter family protein n=2 Tax=Hazenella coriacea TaxID=1179467 RepID=A0A4R3L9R0_9BACL|nr:ABC transporter family protein [Hazenella coriacea]
MLRFRRFHAKRNRLKHVKQRAGVVSGAKPSAFLYFLRERGIVMSLLKVESLSHNFAYKKLYEDASFELYKGEHMGMVGQNGSGKSTLIKIVIGEIVPDQGMVKWQSNMKIGHLDQYAEINGTLTISVYLKSAFADLYETEKKLNHLYEKSAVTGDEALLLQAAAYQEQLEAQDFYSIESQIGKIASGLGIDAMGMDRSIHEWSGGQRAKVILAKLLAEKPNVLLLDEPTNFLDQDHVEWLASFLAHFDGAFIVVSHDYDFLEKISTCICDIEFGTIRKYYGKYSDFLRQTIQVISERFPGLNTKEIRSHLGRCGVRGNHAMQAVGTLSGGEQSKVKLCGLLLASCNFLIMDEPTNHLDAETKKALQNALASFSGSVLLVSHEESFYKAWADRIVKLEHV